MTWERVGVWSETGAVLGAVLGLLEGLHAVGPVFASNGRIAATLACAVGVGCALGAVVAPLARLAVDVLDPGRSSPAPLPSGRRPVFPTIAAFALCLTALGLALHVGAGAAAPRVAWYWRSGLAAVTTVALALGTFRWLARRAAPRWAPSVIAGTVASGLVAATAALPPLEPPIPAGLDTGDPSPTYRARAVPGDAPNILFLVLDTTRADHLSPYGYGRTTTPYLERLAEESTLYEDAISPAPWTLPAHASMFTGLLPSSHLATSEHEYLSPRVATMAEILSRRGYDTVGISCNSVVGSTHGLQRGFGHFFEVYRWSEEQAADPVERLHLGAPLRALLGPEESPDKGAALANILARRSLTRWDREGRRRPFFMFVNLLEAHLPYDPPRPFRDRFVRGPTRPLIEPLFHTTGFSFPYVSRLVGLRAAVGPEDRARLAEHYDGALSYLDFRVEELIEEFRRRGILDDTLVIVVGDHGENLGDHGGLLGHNLSLNQSLIRVPLIVRYPKRFAPGTRYPGLVSTLSVFPTVLSVAGSRNAPEGTYPKELPRSPGDRPADFAVTELALPVIPLANMVSQVPGIDISPLAVSETAIQDGGFKLVIASDGTTKLFDLEADPGEASPNDASGSPKAAALRVELAGFLAGQPKPDLRAPVAVSPLDPASYRSLKALGYVN